MEKELVLEMTKKQFLDFDERNKAVILIFMVRGLVKIKDDKNNEFRQRMTDKYKIEGLEKEVVRTQKEIVRDELLRNKETTNWNIIEKYRITRLSEYIRQLRKEGMNIFSKYVTDKSTGKTHVIYMLIENTKAKPDDDIRGDEVE